MAAVDPVIYNMEQEAFTTHSITKRRKRNIPQKVWAKRRLVFAISIIVFVSVSVALAITISERRDKNKKEEETEVSADIPQEYSGSKQVDQCPCANARLPDDVVPRLYDLSLDVNMEQDKYEGEVLIHLIAKNVTKRVILHQKSLDIRSVKLLEENAVVPETILKTCSNDKYEYLVIELNKLLKVGKAYQLSIKFGGQLRSELNGFYMTTYQSSKGPQKVAATFFSPIYSRKAFPCFDEPKFKANFSIKLTHSRKYHALSNMGELTKTYTNTTITTRFRTTLKMSTYIVSWVISNFKSLKTVTPSGLVLKAWAQPDRLQEVKFGINITQRLLAYFENYFNIPFPLKKLDLVALPSFGPGAMENWGLITYRADRLLYNENTTSEGTKLTIFQINAHELAHQWFGNLATMKFWTDAWLKEGFANFLGAYVGNKLEPSMELMKHSLSSLTLGALDYDAFASSHPISTQASTPDQIRQIFDTITYLKGYCMVQMLREYLGKDFQKGLQEYLITYAYKNADQDDLWKALSKASGKDVKTMMDTWTLQLGYPVVNVTRINSSYIQVTQQRFTLDPPGTAAPTSLFEWKIPLTCKSLHTPSPQTSHLLTAKTGIFEVPENQIINPNHAMFYRVNYQGSMLTMIKDTLITNHTALTVEDRVGVISDQFSTAAAGLSHLHDALDMTRYIVKETDYFPWKTTIDQLKNIYHLTDNPFDRIQLKRYISNLIERMVTKLSWTKAKSVNEGYLQRYLLDVSCRFDNTAVIKKAYTFFREWMASDGQKMNASADLYQTIRECVISQGMDTEWDFIYKMYKKGGSEKDSLGFALTATQQNHLIQRLLNYSMVESEISSQDATYIIARLATQSSAGKYAAWNHIKQNWDELFKKYSNELFLYSHMLNNVIKQFSKEEDLRDIKNFIATRKTLGSGSQAVNQAIVRVQSNIAWKKANAHHLKSWLLQHIDVKKQC